MKRHHNVSCTCRNNRRYKNS